MVVRTSEVNQRWLSRRHVQHNGKLQDLNKLTTAGSGWVLIEADAINDAGQIVGTALKGNEEHGFLLTPQ